MIFAGGRPLAAAAAPLQLRGQQLAEQGGPPRLGDLPLIILDPRPLARGEGGLVAVADPVDPVGQLQGQGAGLFARIGVHGVTSAVHALRISSSLRTTVRSPQPSRSATSSLV